MIPEGSKELPTLEAHIETIVKGDGELFGVSKWETLDIGWLEALEQWLKYFDNKAPFNTNPQTILIPDKVSFAIAGDWGTGDWRKDAPSTKVGAQVSSVNAAYNIHLGDVYYAGTSKQESNNLVTFWPMGSKGGFTLNSNHEMYNGAHSYYEEALTKKFTAQKGCSYFALENRDWLIVGLDTSYYASTLDLFLKGNLNQGQIDWIKTLNKKNKRIMILSHHQGYEFMGEKKSGFHHQVVEGLGREPDYWYWGHLHNAIVYKPMGAFYGRCLGHGALPYGNAYDLEKSTAVAWYETTSANDSKIPLRVVNGFAHVCLDGPKVQEQFIDENGNVGYVCE